MRSLHITISMWLMIFSSLYLMVCPFSIDFANECSVSRYVNLQWVINEYQRMPNTERICGYIAYGIGADEKPDNFHSTRDSHCIYNYSSPHDLFSLSMKKGAGSSIAMNVLEIGRWDYNMITFTIEMNYPYSGLALIYWYFHFLFDF